MGTIRNGVRKMGDPDEGAITEDIPSRAIQRLKTIAINEISKLCEEIICTEEKLRYTLSAVQVDEYPAVPPPMLNVGRIRQGIPEASGVYFVWEGDRVAYVGQSVNLSLRVTGSHGNIFRGDKVSWLEFPLGQLNFAECFYIGTCRPIRNFNGLEKIKESKRLLGRLGGNGI